MNSIRTEIEKQSQNMSWDNFLCSICKNYQGKLICLKGVFIAFTGANMSGCYYFEGGRLCKRCGKYT